MNKRITKFISAILFTSFIFTSIFVLSASAEDDNEEEKIYCVSDHFDKLVYNKYNPDGSHRVPENKLGSCTQLAMSMILTYYDFYWNDSFVPAIENDDGSTHEMGWDFGTFDSSTNTVTKTITAYYENLEWDGGTEWNNNYRDFVDTNKNVFLHPYLIDLSNTTTINGVVGITGLLACQVVNVLEEYFIRNSLINESAITIHFERGFAQDGENNSRETLYESMKAQILQGNPVIFFGLSAGLVPDIAGKLPEEITQDDIYYGGHAMVAYGIENTAHGEDILLHTGWNSTDHEMYSYYKTSPFTLFNSAIWIEIDENQIPHECTEKYIVDNSESKLCACQVYKTHPYHNQNHVYFTKIDNIKQYEECICGDYHVLHYHQNKTYTYINRTIHMESCGLCEYSTKKPHEYYLESISSTQHMQTCNCGKTGNISQHTASTYTYKSKFEHNITCECGYVMGTTVHSVVSDGLNKAHCTDCGARFNTMTDIIIKKEDPEYKTE